MTRSGKKTNKEKKNKVIQKRINIIVVIGLSIMITYGIIYRNNKLKNSDITTCKIVSFGLASGGSGLRPEVVNYEYRVNGKIYRDDSSFPDNKSVEVGNCYKLRYSVDNPQVSEVLFEYGSVDCIDNQM